MKEIFLKISYYIFFCATVSLISSLVVVLIWLTNIVTYDDDMMEIILQVGYWSAAVSFVSLIINTILLNENDK